MFDLHFVKFQLYQSEVHYLKLQVLKSLNLLFQLQQLHSNRKLQLQFLRHNFLEEPN